MNAAFQRVYTIDADPPDVCYPIAFTEIMNLPAVYGTVIVLDDMEYMRTPDGWISAIGEWCTNERMRRILMGNPHASRVVYNTHRASY